MKFLIIERYFDMLLFEYISKLSNWFPIISYTKFESMSSFTIKSDEPHKQYFINLIFLKLIVVCNNKY